LKFQYLKYLEQGFDKDDVLRQIMDEYGNDVWNFSFFLTRRTDVADDISQEVFLQAYRRLNAFRGDCSMKSWLLTIARNKSLNYMKSAFIRKVALVDRIWSREEASPSAEKVMFDRMESARIWNAVMKIPRKFREVVILDYHYDLSIKEIAELLDLSEGTVKSRQYRAKKRISKLLEQE